jgi:hypothetical protein
LLVRLSRRARDAGSYDGSGPDPLVRDPAAALGAEAEVAGLQAFEGMHDLVEMRIGLLDQGLRP